ncbi:MAG: FAD-dependent oxidoreductase [Clostridiales bacterium]|nr:FAD-dependent oxidoreductase [Clostridiales bacterium]
MEYNIDIAVIGGGPAGISAAINTHLRGKSVTIFTNSYKSSPLYKAKKVENYPGLPDISGAKLLDGMYDHLKSMKITAIKAQVLSIADMGEGFYISAGSEFQSAKAVILATGVVQTSFYPGESELLGHGISYCATCDGMLYKGKRVALIGLTGDALEEANQLHDIGCDVTFISPSIKPDKLKPGIKVLKGSKFEFKGEKKLKALIIDGVEHEFDGVFITRASVAPDLLLPGLDIKDGFIQVDKKMQTNIAGVFAAGDCTGKPNQILKATGQGQIAAFSATAYIDEREQA